MDMGNRNMLPRGVRCRMDTTVTILPVVARHNGMDIHNHNRAQAMATLDSLCRPFPIDAHILNLSE